MNRVVAWFKSKSITAHSVAAVLVGLATVVATDAQAQQVLAGLFIKHPAAAAEIICLAGIIAKYSHSSSPAGSVAKAQQILAAPNAPTAEQILAASSSPK